MAIAFIPIDIDVRLPDEKVLLNYIENYCVNKNPDPDSTWKIGPVKARLTDEEWYDPNISLNALYQRYNKSTIHSRYANNVDKIMPEIPFLLDQLPFTEITMAAFFLQIREVEHHIDPHKEDVYTDPSEIAIDLEPHRYNILLTQHSKPSFFVSKTATSEKIHPLITKDSPCFAFCERYHWHGADYIGPNKVLLTVFGILDREKHRNILEINKEKHKDQVILFPDPIDPSDLKYHFQEKIVPY